MEYPSPDDVPTLLLQALGAPVVVVSLVAFALFVASWVQFGFAAARYGGTAARSVGTFVREKSTSRTRWQIAFAFLAVPFTVLAVAGARLGPLYLGQSVSNPIWRDWAWIGVLSEWTSETGWYLFAVALSLFLLGLSRIANIRFLQVVLAAAWLPVFLAGALVGIIWVVALAGNLLMLVLTTISQTPSSTYSVATAAGFFVLALTHWGTPYFGMLLWEHSKPAFGSENLNKP